MCVNCGIKKTITEFDRRGEHIIPYGYGNDGTTEAILKNKICAKCNQDYGNVIDRPFLRYVMSRKIQKDYNMKRRHNESEPLITGSGIVIRYATSIAHIFESIKIAFETHIKFLHSGYRDDVFYMHKKFLNDVIQDYTNMKVYMKSHSHRRRTFDEIWADTGQGTLFSKYSDIINRNIYRLDEVTNNSAEIIAILKNRSSEGSYSSLIQLSCWNFGLGVMICLQSLPPIIVKVCSKKDLYIKEFGHECAHVMDIRKNEKGVGIEDNIE